MAHELSEVSGRTEIFYYGETPWHGLGTAVDQALTAEEAIKAAGLDWTVEKRQVFFEEEPGIYKAANEFATVRTDANLPLGIVSQRYQPIQNQEAFNFMDDLVMSKEAKYHTAGALFQGQKIWLLCKIPGDIVVLDNDHVDKYLLLCNRHDGQGSLRVHFTPIRVVCQNTLNLANQLASTSVYITHTGDLQTKITEARRILGIAANYFSDLQMTFKAFAAKKLTGDQAAAYVLTVMPGQSKFAENARAKVFELHEAGAGAEMTRGTLWGIYNAITEYVDHHRTDHVRRPDRYIDTINFGSGAEIKTRAFEEALNILND